MYKRQVRFYEALVGNENLETLAEGDYFGFCVDAGLGCVCDEIIHRIYFDWDEPVSYTHLVIRNGREFVEVTFGNDNDIRLSLSKEENVLLVGGRAYLPAEDFVLAEFFDRYVKMAFIDYSAIKETAPRKEEDKRPPLPEGYLEKLQQVRYSDHTVRVYTSYFRDFQQHFEGRKIETVTPGEINDYLLYLIHEKNISSCQQNQRINAIKFYYEKVLGQERRCYKVNRAKREKTLPDVLSKEEIKKILDVTVTDLRFFCMFSILSVSYTHLGACSRQ